MARKAKVVEQAAAAAVVTPAVKATKRAAKRAAKREQVAETVAVVAEPNKLEALTKATQESKVITFREGKGSQDLLNLIATLGFDREKVLAAAAKLKKSGKAFTNCDPEKKYRKVAGIIKSQMNAGYKLPKVAASAA